MKKIKKTIQAMTIRLKFQKKNKNALIQASMTVEASLVLPLFIFFMAEILYIFEMIRLQSGMIQALHETGTAMSEYAFYMEYAVDDLVSLTGNEEETILSEEDWADDITSYGISFLLSETYVKNSVEDYLGTKYLNHTCLKGGASSISYLQSQILTDDDVIDLVADYQISPFLSVFGLNSFSMQSRYYGHAWTGYTISSSDEGDNDENEEEEIVYITSQGSVYHTNKNCTYLNPSVTTIDASLLDTIRSSDGSIYYACEVCHPSKTGTVVITEDGNRYHSSASCSSIKRTILSVPLSSVEDSMRCCSKCSGG